jgi:hypothetical protein
MRPRTREISIPSDGLLAGAKRFRRYKKEAEKRETGPEVEKDRKLEVLLKVVQNISSDEMLGHLSLQAMMDSSEGFESLSGLEDVIDTTNRDLDPLWLRPLRGLSADEVSRFCMAIRDVTEDEFNNRVGYALELMILFGKDERYELSFEHMEGDIMELGTANDKEVIINGSVSSVGFSMRGGRIIVKGDTFYDVGQSMKGGTIIVEGDSQGTIGESMKGGEIHVYGEIGDIEDIEGGRIYHKGKLIVDK